MACLKHIPYENGEVEEVPEITAPYLRPKSANFIDPNEPLDKKSKRSDILAKLAQIEQEVIARAKAHGVI